MDEDDYDEEPDYDDEEYFDCGMTREGYCTKAGSEECDWECPLAARNNRRKTPVKDKEK